MHRLIDYIIKIPNILGNNYFNNGLLSSRQGLVFTSIK